MQRVWEVARVFGRLGLTAFGGPAAHVAMMRRVVVEEHGWLSEQEFMDLLGVTNLLPGPNSTEMAIHLGYRRAGWAGLLVGGVCFIAPAMLLVLLLAWLYVRYGALPQAKWLFDGLTPVIIAIIAHALFKLRRSAAPRLSMLLLAGAALLAVLAGVNELLLLLGVALAQAALAWRRDAQTSRGLLPLLGAPTASAAAWGLGSLFWTFLKIGSVLYGSGYVLLAFLRADFVERLGWLSEQQLLDAVAVGQFTPGPLFTTATFVGYVVGAQHGVALPAALLATLGIFAPAFGFVALCQPILRQLQQSLVVRRVLDGVNAVSLGLMGAVLVQLALATWRTTGLPYAVLILLTTISLAALAQTRVNATWLLLAGAALSWVLQGSG